MQFAFLADLLAHYHAERDGLCCKLVRNIEDEPAVQKQTGKIKPWCG